MFSKEVKQNIVYATRVKLCVGKVNLVHDSSVVL